MLEGYIHENIPISQGMNIKVVRADEKGVELNAPLAPNSNHKGTVFGGSAISVMVISCWSWLWLELRRRQISAEVVVQVCDAEFHRPITGDFSAFCPGPSSKDLAKFWKALEAKGKSRLKLESGIFSGETRLASFTGHFVAIKT